MIKTSYPNLAYLLALAALNWSLLLASAAEVITPCFLKLSLYENVEGSAVADLIGNPNYPASPSQVRYLRSFNTRDALPTDELQSFGGRIEGFLTPLETGEYHFFLRSDAASELWLSADETSGGALLIAEETDRGDPFMEPDTFDLATTQAPITLTAGKRYFIMVLYKGHTGGGNSTDFAQVAWRKVGDPTPAAELQPISAAFLSTRASDAGGPAVVISQPPASATAAENSRVTFTVAADVFPATPVCFQWQRNGVNIPGANGSSYQRYLDQADNGARFRAVVAVPGASATSAEATVTVTPDQTRPELVSAKGGPNQPKVVLTFLERVSAASATTLGNYRITGPTGTALNVTGAVLSPDRTQVTLTTAAQTVGTEYTVTVNNVTDLAAAAPNAIAANSQVKFHALGPWLQGEDGFVVWEAEDFDRNLDGRWSINTDRGVPSGGASVVNYNGAGGSEAATQLEYDIFFTKTGTHIFWYRNSGNDGNDDSFWLYLDGARPAERVEGNRAAMSGFTTGLQGNFGWSSSPFEGGGRATFTITTPGLNTIAVARREDGSYLDKFLITTDPNFNPTTDFGAFGPPVTLRQGEPRPAGADFLFTTHPVNTQAAELSLLALTAAVEAPAGTLIS